MQAIVSRRFGHQLRCRLCPDRGEHCQPASSLLTARQKGRAGRPRSSVVTGRAGPAGGRRRRTPCCDRAMPKPRQCCDQSASAIWPSAACRLRKEPSPASPSLSFGEQFHVQRFSLSGSSTGIFELLGEAQSRTHTSLVPPAWHPAPRCSFKPPRNHGSQMPARPAFFGFVEACLHPSGSRQGDITR